MNIGAWFLAGRAAAEREERKPALRETRERILEASIRECTEEQSNAQAKRKFTEMRSVEKRVGLGL